MIFHPEQAQVSALANRVKAAQNKTSMIVLSIGFSIGMYMAIGLIILSMSKQTPASSNNEMQFLIAAGLLAFASIAYRRSQFARLRLEVIATIRGLEGLIKHFVQTTIISVAIAEIIGLLGLLIIFFGGTARDVLILGIVGIALVFSNYPRREAWLKTAQYFESNLYKDETETKDA